MSGNTKSFVDYLVNKYEGDYTIISPTDFLENYKYTQESWDMVFLGCYTWGEGKIPENTKKAVIKHREWLYKQNLFIFGTGWTMYPHFCRAVDSIKIIVGRKVKAIKYELNYNMKQNRLCDKIVDSFIKKTIQNKGESK